MILLNYKIVKGLNRMFINSDSYYIIPTYVLVSPFYKVSAVSIQEAADNSSF